MVCAPCWTSAKPCSHVDCGPLVGYAHEMHAKRVCRDQRPGTSHTCCNSPPPRLHAAAAAHSMRTAGSAWVPANPSCCLGLYTYCGWQQQPIKPACLQSPALPCPVSANLSAFGGTHSSIASVCHLSLTLLPCPPGWWWTTDDDAGLHPRRRRRRACGLRMQALPGTCQLQACGAAAARERLSGAAQ